VPMVMRRVAVVTAVLAGLLFMHAFLAAGARPAPEPMTTTPMAMASVPAAMGEQTAVSNDGEPTGHRGHDGLHIAGLCLAVLLAGAVVVIGPRRFLRFVPAVDRAAARTHAARLVRRPKRPPGLTELCVSIC